MDPMTQMVRDRTAELQRVASAVRLERALRGSNVAGSADVDAGPVAATGATVSDRQPRPSIAAREGCAPCGPCEPATAGRAA